MTNEDGIDGAAEVEVLVIGCGPVGVMAALRCAQRGLSVLAVDRSDEIYPLPRAIGMDAEMQSLFSRAGLASELDRHSSALPGAEFVNRAGERVVGLEEPPGTVGALGFPRMITFDQPGVEGFLRRAARDAGVELRLGHEVVSLAQDDDAMVRVGIESASGHQEVTARWVIAADGAKSTIRARCGIDLVDQGFDQTWLVVDATLLDPELALPRLATQFCDPDRICTFVPGTAAHRRWEFRLHADETREQVLDDLVIAGLLAPWGNEGQLRIDRSAVYRFHATVAATLRHRSVFLAGDAAHQMPPFNGQGMCTGLRDAENLSWKLAAVAAGHADDRLLDTYDEERRPHAADQVAHAVDAGLLIEAIATDGEAALGSGYGQRPFPAVEGRYLTGPHRRVGHPLPAPTVGPPPPRDGWLLIRRSDGPTVPARWASLGATVHTVADGAYPGLVEDQTVAVVRPDRIIAAVTTDLGPVTDRLSEVVTALA